jgi:quercetin dioxygenase-like cupin family protein
MATGPMRSAHLTPSGRPRRITNPVIGDVVTFVESTEETGGKRLVAEIQLAARGGNPMHVHRGQTKSFEVMEGDLSVTVAGQTRVLKPGDQATVPPGTAHRFFSETDVSTTFRVTILNPGGLEDGLRIAYGMARDGKTPNGLPRDPLVIALGTQLSDMYLASVPIWLQLGIFKAMAALTRALGYEKRLGVYLAASGEKA